MTNPTTNEIARAFLAARAKIPTAHYPALALVDLTARSMHVQSVASCVASFNGNAILRRDGGSFAPIKKGDTIRISGTVSNNITTRVTNATASSLVVEANLISEYQEDPELAEFGRVTYPLAPPGTIDAEAASLMVSDEHINGDISDRVRFMIGTNPASTDPSQRVVVKTPTSIGVCTMRGASFLEYVFDRIKG